MGDSEASSKVFMFMTHKTVSFLLNFPSKSLLVIIKYGITYLLYWACSNMEFEQAPVTDNHLQSICGKVSARWRDLGAILGLKPELMNDMDTDLSDCREKALKVLQKWRERNGKGATMGILINALKRLDRKDVVVKLRIM